MKTAGTTHCAIQTAPKTINFDIFAAKTARLVRVEIFTAEKSAEVMVVLKFAVKPATYVWVEIIEAETAARSGRVEIRAVEKAAKTVLV